MTRHSPIIPELCEAPHSAGANGQFLGERRFLTAAEQTIAVEAFIAKSPSLTEDECNLVRGAWNACVAFGKVAGFDGFDEALASLRGELQEVSATS